MHTDQKIGFALGILLVGVVAALFFRNEPLLPPEAAGVRRERELNERLRERDVAVYLEGSGTGESRTAHRKESDADDTPWTLKNILGVMGRRNRGGATPVNELSDEVPDGRPPQAFDASRPTDTRTGSGRGKNETPANRSSPNSSSVAATSELSKLLAGETGASFRSEDTPRPLPPPPRLDPSKPVDPTRPAGITPASTVPDSDGAPVGSDFQPPAEYDEYIVQYGDTLSGIARRFLGTQSRYGELYDANRDRMDSPDRLTVGKPLRIPRKSNVPPEDSGGY